MKNLLLLAGAAMLIAIMAWPGQAQTFNVQLDTERLKLLPSPSPTDPHGNFSNVIPANFDPSKTYLVQSTWLNGIGCPTNAFTADLTGATTTFVDTACITGDPNDRRNMGLLLVKTGPTPNFAAATAELVNVKGITLTELGYDIRKSSMSTVSPTGSHCGAGTPRFDVVTSDGTIHFIGCNSPPGVLNSASNDWIRLRWGAAELSAAFPPITPSDIVQRIVIIFDEGTDISPDFFGAAILDNIDVNGTLVGRGPR